jgi:penicillin amidase
VKDLEYFQPSDPDLTIDPAIDTSLLNWDILELIPRFAVAELTKRFGSDMERSTLGVYHHAIIVHLISSALKAEDRARFDVGDLPRGGDSYTINATGGTDNHVAGRSLKVIVDTEVWDNSIAQNNPGQSGDVNDPHYRDLYELWARGKYFPILFSRARIESVMEKKVHLNPTGVEAALRSGGQR